MNFLSLLDCVVSAWELDLKWYAEGVLSFLNNQYCSSASFGVDFTYRSKCNGIDDIVHDA